MNDYEALLHQAERLEALQEIRNLMGRYSYLHSAFRNKEYAELWAKREDDKLVMPFGKFVGWEAVRHCYVDLHGDRNNPDDIDELRGLMMIHLMNTVSGCHRVQKQHRSLAKKRAHGAGENMKSNSLRKTAHGNSGT